MAQIKNVLFGKLAVSTRFITEEQLQECLDYQKELEERGERPPRLGEILEQKGYLTKQQIQSILETMSSMQRRRFGEIAVAFHFITLEQLETCLDIQKLLTAPQETVPLFGQALVTYRNFLKQVLAGGAHPKIGDVLCAMGYMRQHQVDAVLEEQNKRIVRCRSCEASLNISRFEPGQKIKCGQCNAVLEIVKPAGSEELDVALPTDTVSTTSPGAAEEDEERPLDPATALAEVEKALAERRATQQFAAAAKKMPGRIADFQVVTRLGQDATGVIFKATQMSKNRPVALKIMNPSVMNDPNFQKKFIDDAKKVASLDHPHIKKVYSLGKSENRFYIAMEFVEAESVYNVLEKQGKFHFETAIGIAINLAEALQYANQQGVIHGDLRPSNILVLKDGTVKLANLGLATKVSENILAISRSGQMAPFYIAPECVTGDREMDLRTDIYSLGATMFHMIAGRPPFQGQSPFEVLVRLTEETIPPLKFFDPSIPDTVCRVVEKMLEAEPQDRFQTWEEVLTELRAIQIATGGASRVAAPPGSPAAARAAAIQTAEEAKRQYENRAARAAALRSLRRAMIIIVAVLGLAAGGLFVKNKFAESERLKEWRTTKTRAVNSGKGGPGDYDRAYSLLNDFMSRYPATPEADEARDEIRLLQKAEAVDRENEVESILKKADEYVKARSFKDAKAWLRKGAWNPFERTPKLQTRDREIDAAAEADWQGIQDRALGLAEEEKFRQAQELVKQSVGSRALPGDEEKGKALLEQIAVIEKRKLEERRKREEEARLKDSLAKVDKCREKARADMNALNAESALDSVSALLAGDQVHPDHLKVLRELKLRIEYLKELRDAANAVLKEEALRAPPDPAQDKRVTHKLKINGQIGRTIGSTGKGVEFMDKGGVKEMVGWGELDALAQLVPILKKSMDSALTPTKQFAFAEACLYRAEATRDGATKKELMTRAELYFKLAGDNGLAEQAKPFADTVQAWFKEAKAETLNEAVADAAAGKLPDARKKLVALENNFEGRLEEQRSAVDAAWSQAAGNGAAFEPFDAGTGAWKASAGWTVAQGLLKGSGKDETLECKGAASEVGVLMRFDDKDFGFTVELGSARVFISPEKGTFNADILKEDGNLEDRKPFREKAQALFTERKWHLLAIREVGANGANGLEIWLDGTLIVPAKDLPLTKPLSALSLKLGGSSMGRTGAIQISGIFHTPK